MSLQENLGLKFMIKLVKYILHTLSFYIADTNGKNERKMVKHWIAHLEENRASWKRLAGIEGELS